MESIKSQGVVNAILDWFDYDPINGLLIRKRKTRSDAFDEIEYCHTVFFQGKDYPYTTLCWVIYYGKFPDNWIDHKDRIKAHNWITNLREVTPTQNQQNKAGYGQYPKGVVWRNRPKAWAARIRVNGERICLGNFYTMEEAAKAYQEACIKYHGEFACPI